MGFKTQQRLVAGINVISLQGQLDASQVASFKKDWPHFLQNDQPKILLECEALEFVDSTGLGSLISLLRKVEEKGGKIVFAQMTAEVASIFEITRLQKLFNIFPNLKDAVDRLQE